MSRLLVALGLVLSTICGSADPQPVPDRVGDTYEIRLRHEMRSEATDGSRSSSSQGGHEIVERVIAVRDDGLEIEFDFPPGTTDADRARDWALPTRVLRTADGSFQLLNAAELEQRIDAWLTLGGIPREACGHWIFTWNAFKIECDPQSVIATLEPFDLRPVDLRDGAAYALSGAVAPAVLRLERQDENGAVYTATAELDADAVRLERAETELVVAEISGEMPPTIEEAMQARASDHISGTLTLTIETDALGRVIGRTTVVEMDTTDSDGVTEHEVRLETVQRRLVSEGPAESD